MNISVYQFEKRKHAQPQIRFMHILRQVANDLCRIYVLMKQN